MRRLLLLIVLPLVVWASGCAPRSIVEEAPDVGAVAFPHHSLDQVLMATEAVAARDSLFAFSSQARLAIRSPQQNADASATLRQRGADTLWASVRGPLNIEVARALFTPDSFRVHDRLRNRLYHGSAEAAQQLFPGPTGPEEVFRTLTGTLTPDPSVGWILTPGSINGTSAYWLTAPDASARLAVDPRSWRLLRYERLASNGRVVDSRRFGDFAAVEGRILPHRVELSNPADQVEVVIEHRRLSLNPDALAFPFSPGTAQRIPFGEGTAPFGGASD